MRKYLQESMTKFKHNIKISQFLNIKWSFKNTLIPIYSYLLPLPHPSSSSLSIPILFSPSVPIPFSLRSWLQRPVVEVDQFKTRNGKIFGFQSIPRPQWGSKRYGAQRKLIRLKLLLNCYVRVDSLPYTTE